MKKTGFTLTELLITIAIIGVVAALSAPVVTNLTPDKNKMMFMKNYNEVVTITEKLLSDPELYQTQYAIAQAEGVDIDSDGEIDFQEGQKYPTCIGLQCLQQPIRVPYNTEEYSKGKKYPRLLASYLGYEEVPKTNEFQTSDNTYWEVGEYYISKNDGPSVLDFYQIFFSVNQDKAERGVLYNETDTKINTFRLRVDFRGNVTPVDALSKAYLINSTNMHDKKKDFACAKLIHNDDSGKHPSEICKDIYK